MVTDGALMRLGKHDFRTLLNEPMLDWVDLRRSARRSSRAAASGSTCACRREFETYRIEGAINVPLYFIRLKLKTLDRSINTSCAATRADAAPRAPSY